MPASLPNLPHVDWFKGTETCQSWACLCVELASFVNIWSVVKQDSFVWMSDHCSGEITSFQSGYLNYMIFISVFYTPFWSS